MKSPSTKLEKREAAMKDRIFASNRQSAACCAATQIRTRINRGARHGGCPYHLEIDGKGSGKPIRTLFSTAKEAEDDTGGSPIIVLVNIGTERSPVVVEVEHADFPVPGRVDIQAATHFVRQAVR